LSVAQPRIRSNSALAEIWIWLCKAPNAIEGGWTKTIHPSSASLVRFDPKFESEHIFPIIGKDCLGKTRPIFTSDGGPDDLRALGTCFFIKYFNHYFLISAGHVLAEKAKLYTRIHGRPGPLAPDLIDGMRIFVGHHGKLPGTDGTDLGFVELDATEATLAPDSYFDASRWDEDDRPTWDAVYLSCGWPAAQNDPDRIFPDLPQEQKHFAFFNQSLPPARYHEHRIDPATHYAIEHEDRQLDLSSKMSQPPNMDGVSGSPLLFVHRYGSDTGRRLIRTPKLVGVVIEHHPSRRCIIATRLCILLAGIRAHMGGDNSFAIASKPAR